MAAILEQLRAMGIAFTDHGDYVKFRCINPHHPGGDAHPSMTLRKDTGFFKCWSCGYRGSFKRLCKVMGGDLSFADSLLWENQTQYSAATKEYHMNITGEPLPVYSNPVVMGYLRSRHITDEFIDYFDIFYADRLQINTSFWNKRVCIPIYEGEHLVNIEGRDYTREQEKKVLYPRGSKAGMIFNFDNLDLTKPVILTEGIMDLPPIFQVYTNVGALFGNGLSNQQRNDINLIPDLILLPDNDTGGRTLVTNIDEFYHKEFRIGMLPDDRKDPGQCSVEEIRKVLDTLVGANEFVALTNGIYSRQQKIVWG